MPGEGHLIQVSETSACLAPACACEYGPSGTSKPTLASIFTLFFSISLFFLMTYSGLLCRQSHSSPSLHENEMIICLCWQGCVAGSETLPSAAACCMHIGFAFPCWKATVRLSPRSTPACFCELLCQLPSTGR